MYSMPQQRTRAHVLLATIWLAMVCATVFASLYVHVPQLAWSQHKAGPLVCISDGRNMECAAEQLAVFNLGPAPGTAPQRQIQPTAAPDAQLQAQLNCIALAVFTEGRGESYFGQAAIAQTVVNRSMAAAQSPCNVVTALAQYQGVENLTDDPWRIDQAAWDKSLQVAQSVMSQDYDLGACAAAVSFHARGDDLPKWAADQREVCRVGRHRFYAEG